MVRNIYSWMAGNASAPESSWPSQSSVESAISYDYNLTNATPAFRTLVATWGNYTTGVNWLNASGVSNISYSIFWEQWSGSVLKAHLEYWMGILCLGGGFGSCTPISGPYNLTWTPTTASTTIPNNSWAAYELYTPSLNTLWYASEWTKVQPLTTPSTGPLHVPSGTTVDPVGSVWAGLSPSSGGFGGLLQTGYITDTKGTYNIGYACPNGLWWELYPTYASIVPYVTWRGNICASAWDVLWMEARNAGAFWWWTQLYTYVYDYHLGYGSTAAPTTSSGWSPRYAQGIVEANGVSGVLQQLPEWEGQIPIWWWGTLMMSNGNGWSVNSLISLGDYNVYTPLSQRCNYNSATSTWDSVQVASDTTWVSSQYDYTCL